MKTEFPVTEPDGRLSAVKTVHYRKRGADGAVGRVSLRTLREMIARWEVGPDDFIRLEGDTEDRRVRECPALAPLDEMLHDATEKVIQIRQVSAIGSTVAPREANGSTVPAGAPTVSARADAPARSSSMRGMARRVDVVRELGLLCEYAEFSDRVYSAASFLLGWLRFAESPALARGHFLKAIEHGYPHTSVARNDLAVAQIRLGDPAGRDNLILAANDSQRTPAALFNLARLLEHLQGLGEATEEIANIKDILRVARSEWKKAPPVRGEPASFALFLCKGDIPDSFASEAQTMARVQGQLEDVLAEGEDCLRQGRLEQASAHAARAAAEIDRTKEDLAKNPQQKGTVNPLRFLSVRFSRLEKATAIAREARERQGQLDLFRRRLRSIEESFHLKAPPADLIQQAELLLNSARTEAERAEGRALLRECSKRVVRHLLETANDHLEAGEKDAAVGLLRRAQSLESDLGEEIKLRLASLRRDELEKEILQSLDTGGFQDARARIALLRSIHPIFEPLSARLEGEINAGEAGHLLDRIVAICGESTPSRESILEAQSFLERARQLHPEPLVLKPIEAHIVGLCRKFGIQFAHSKDPRDKSANSAPPLQVIAQGSKENSPNSLKELLKEPANPDSAKA